MKRNYARSPLLLSALMVLSLCHFAAASSVIPLSPGDHLNASAVVFRGIVVGADCFRDATDGVIYTRTSLRVIEKFKGTFPAIIGVVHAGGAMGAEREFAGQSPRLLHGGEYVLHVVRRADGKLTATQGAASAVRLARQEGQLSAEQEAWLQELRMLANNNQLAGDDVTDQAGFITSSLVTGLLETNGISSRFLQADRGEPIPVLIDADTLPAGITLAQATNAVMQACNAWAAVTKLKFKIEGIQSFGAGADAVANNDEKLRIQLHDNYGRINSPGTLGIGGRVSLSSPVGSTGWNLGGRVGTNEFYKTARGYVVLEHGAATLQNLASFTEVLCHEIGHALSMAHSSENSGEANSLLKQAIMFYQVHADGRGATLGAYDPPVIAQAYPANNTPPYSYNRVMYVTTDDPSPPNVSGINELEMRGYDLQVSPLTMETNGAMGVGTGSFSKSGSTLKFTPNDYWNTTPSDPASSSYYELIYVRYSDGTNASPYVTVRVLSHSADDFPTIGDGIPNAWMTTYFGNANPAIGINHGSNQDADGDGLKNIDEYRAGMDPTDPLSAQRITLITKTNLEFQAKAYELYELHGSTNLVNWFRAANPILPTTDTGTFTDFTNTAPHMFFRVQKVP